MESSLKELAGYRLARAREMLSALKCKTLCSASGKICEFKVTGRPFYFRPDAAGGGRF